MATVQRSQTFNGQVHCIVYMTSAYQLLTKVIDLHDSKCIIARRLSDRVQCDRTDLLLDITNLS